MYELSLGAFFSGFIILILGVLFVRSHRWVADNFGGGVGSYEQYRFWALIVCGLGILVMLNIHSLILGWLFGALF